MKSSYSTLMQSKYFNPAFNSAIFDGPVRIYFAQFHEAQALKIYFSLQQKLVAEMAQAKEAAKNTGANILVMVYPTPDSFAMSFETSAQTETPFETEKWNEDVVIGLRGPLDDEYLDLLLETLRLTMETWRPMPKSQSVPALEI